MADYAVTYRQFNNTVRTIDSDGSELWTYTGSAAPYYFAANRTDGYFALCRNSGSYTLELRSTTDGSELYSEALAAEERPFAIDHNNYVWTNQYGTNVIKKWDPDLSSSQSYTINGSCSASDIYNITMTEDGDYIAFTGPGTGARNYVTMVSTANPSGTPIWNSPDLGTNNCSQVMPGPDNDIFVAGFGSGFWTKRLSGIDGTAVWGSDYVMGALTGSYVFETGRYFTATYNASIIEYRQYNIDTRAQIGDTATPVCQTYCFQAWDENIGYGGASLNAGNNTGIRQYDISSDWGSNKAANWDRQDGVNQYHIFVGDSTGYLHERMVLNNSTTPSSTGLPMNFMMVYNL